MWLGSGRYGAIAGLTVSSCTDACPGGKYCPVNSTAPLPCPPGRYSSRGAAVCVDCPAGQYSATESSTTCTVCPAGAFCAAGSATPTLCDAGRFSAATGLATACTSSCTAGYACPPGSTNGTALPCLPGTYSGAGAGACTPCPAGRFGSAIALTVAACSGPCLAGYQCSAGSTVNNASACPPGTYSLAGSTSCLSCPAGTYGATAGLPNASCTGGCNAGYVTVLGFGTVE